MNSNPANSLRVSKSRLISGIQLKMAVVALVAMAGLGAFLSTVGAQTKPAAENLPPTTFRIGEKLTYELAFGRFQSAGFAELAVVSRGKLEGRDAVELEARLKTSELVSATFLPVDENRTTFAGADSGLPIYARLRSLRDIIPTDKINNYLPGTAPNHDIVTMIYRLRAIGGSGVVTFQEGEKIYSISAAPQNSEQVKTVAGEFETVVTSIQSDYLTEIGLTEVRINFTTDERKIPVLIRFKQEKNAVSLRLVGLQSIPDAPVATPTPTPTPVTTPTPTPTPAKTPSRDNQPLSANLPFVLGETLDYRISAGNAAAGEFRLQATERRLVPGVGDVLTLSFSTSKSGGADLFGGAETATALVDAESISPLRFTAKGFSGTMAGLNQSVFFDQVNGLATVNAGQGKLIPLNTHSLLSLVYAMRSFSLTKSLDPQNPIYDTRVSVFHGNQPLIFIIRPLENEVLTIGPERVVAQKLAILTGDPQLESLGIRVWLANDAKRTPLRFAIGRYTADLIRQSVILPEAK